MMSGVRHGTPSATLLVLPLGALVVFGVLADRALVDQARVAREAARDGVAETARLTALTVRATLAQVEQAVVAGRPPERVASERLAGVPSRLPVRGIGKPYGSRPRTELATLLESTATTPNGLPEAVVAQLALGEGPVSASSRDVVERLLGGRLPVLSEDLPALAGALGAGDDPRVAALQERLRLAPDVTELPALPAFRRALTKKGDLEGWSRRGDERIRYEIGVSELLERAGVQGRASRAAGDASDHDSSHHVVPVPEVAGLLLSVTVDPPGGVRLKALRLALWTAVVCSGLGLVAVRRALALEARATAREKGFLAGVTHELRTPLAAIRLLGETLADGRGDAREYGTLISRESERLEALVERVLAVTRLDEAARFERVRPAEVVASAAALIRPRAERRAVTVRCDASGAPGEATWDGEAVRRAVLNLLDNAVTHGRDGGHVAVRVGAIGGEARIEVRDDGPGIVRRDVPRLFGRFARGASAAAGTGLGLYLVDQVARAHGGRVDLTTEEGKGATFTLVLPLHPVACPPEPGTDGAGAA